MSNVDVYKQYFLANCTYDGVARHGALVWLNAESDCGNICYKVGVSFFPHVDEEDFAIFYDACIEKEVLNIKGRRSKKRDAQCLEKVKITANEIALSLHGTIDWNTPISEVNYG